MNLRLSAALSAVVIVLAGSGAAAINFAVLDSRPPLQSETVGLGAIAPSARPDVTQDSVQVIQPTQPTNSSEPQPTNEPITNPSIAPTNSPTPVSTFDCKDDEDESEDIEGDDDYESELDDDFDEDNCGDD